MKAALRALAPLAALSALLVAGCAQDVGDIVRVQPNFVKKSDFDGQWYIRNTVVEVPYYNGVSFAGMTLDMEKICWEISEDHLIGYRSYELSPGKSPEVDHANKEIGNTLPADPNAEYRNNDCYHDAPVVAYRIASHFDIQRQYNPATGEQTNVIVENGSDRPWYQRQFMRVDWSKNLVSSFFGDVNFDFDLAEYVEASEGGDYGFKMETAAGEPVNLDPTSPGVFDELFSGSREPAAYIDVTRRILAKQYINYYGKQYPACLFVGNEHLDCNPGDVKVRTSILKVPAKKTYEPRVYDDGRMNKFGFFRTERETWDDQYGHTDSGRIQLANLHNLWETAYDDAGNLIPVRDRTPKPIVYALNADYPADLIPEAEELAKGYSEAFTRAVAAALNKPVDQIAEQFPYEDAQGNYVNEGLFRLDYNADGHAKIGDLRYNFITVINEAQGGRMGLLGYGPSSADPETGEVIAAQAHLYGASLDLYARRGLDMVRAINGDLPVDVPMMAEGSYVSDYIQQVRDEVDPRQRLAKLGLSDRLERSIDSTRLENVAPAAALRIEAMRQFGLEQVQESFDQRVKRVEGTNLEPLLLNKEIRETLAAQYDDRNLLNAAAGQDLTELARPLTIGEPEGLEQDRLRRQWARDNNIWLAEATDGALLGLAEWLAKQDWTEEEMFTYVRKKVFQAVAEHEVGHTVGLRHNWQGSYDSINYQDEYWQLRKENIAPLNTMQSVGDVLAMSAQTPAQIEGRMRDYQYSSIMDYGGRFSTDWHGLGKYDEAAILFGYSDFVEVFEATGNAFRDRYLETFSDGTPRFENQLTLAYPNLLEATHYTQIPFMMGDGNKDLGIQRMMDRKIIAYEDMQALREDNRDDRYVEVPYLFCSDEWTGAKNSCNPRDMGADLWEMTESVIEGWRTDYWFNNFRRNRATWDPYTTYRTSYGRYFDFINSYYIHWVFDLIQRNYDRTDPGQLQGLYAQYAAMEGLNFLTGIVTQAPYGSFVLDSDNNQYVWTERDHEVEGADLVVQPGVGRRPWTRYDYRDGGYYYYRYPQEASHYWDYRAALLAISRSTAEFRGMDTQSDFYQYVLPYYMMFSEELTPIFNGIITEDASKFAPRVVENVSGVKSVVAKPAVDWLGVLADEVDSAPTIDTYNTWSKRIYALLYSFSGFTSQWSIDYVDEHRIVRYGSGETLVPSEGWEVLTYEDDQGGLTYGTLQEIGAERDTAAATLIKRANELKAARKAAELRAEDLNLPTAERDAAADEAQDLFYEIESLVDWMELERGFSNLYNTVL